MDRRALLEQYAPYVRGIAGKIKKTVPKEMSFDELYDYGIIGLLEAADRFDPDQGVNFTTFAYYRIRGAIYDGLRGMGWMSRTAYAKARFEARANSFLQESTHGPTAEGTPTAPEDLHPFEEAVGTLASAVQGLAAVYLTSLDAALEAELADTTHASADEKLELDQLRTHIRRLIRKLPDEERKLLEMYYYKDMSMQQVGDALGLSKSWTSRLHARVIDKLHRMLEQP